MNPTRFRLVDGDHLIAVGVYRTERRNTHTGVIYREADGRAWFLHHAWHNQCLNEPLPSNLLHVVPELPEPRARFFVRLAAQVARHPARQQLPYAFRNPNNVFVTPDGRILHNGNGLNCSYFVAAFFASYGFPLVDVSTWQFRPEDADWHQQLLVWLTRTDPAQAARVQPEVGCERVRPEELAGAAAFDNRPVTFADGQLAGIYVLALLDTPNIFDSAL